MSQRSATVAIVTEDAILRQYPTLALHVAAQPCKLLLNRLVLDLMRRRYTYIALSPRWVGSATASCPDDVPWQRVINAQGKISGRPGA